MRYFLGVDVGNSKSHALIASETGQVLGMGSIGAGSWETLGWPEAQRRLHQVVNQALRDVGIEKKQIAGAGFGYAGYDWPEDKNGHTEMIQSLGLSAPYALVNDGLLGLIGSSTCGYGIAISAGTSNNCLGRDTQGNIGRITGMGAHFGEFGGANEIVYKAIHAVAYAWSQRAPQTALTDVFIQETGAKDAADLLAGLARKRYHLRAACAPLVFRAANEGDIVAQQIVTWSAHELAESALGVARQLNMLSEAFEIVLSGSVFKAGSAITTPLQEKVLASASKAFFTEAKSVPATGAVILAMETARFGITQTIRETLQEFTPWEKQNKTKAPAEANVAHEAQDQR